jgi:CubicO group peptidase (beta-lactamase class C family)
MDARFQANCEAAALAWDVPALAAGIAVGGTSETFAVGCDPATRFRVASITKPFTAMLALDLLDLEAGTGVWPADVQVRHLLSHTSGYDCELPERDLARFGDGDGALAAAVAELDSVRRFLGVEEIWSYANTGYWLAGHLCAQAAGTSYEEAVDRRILRPAGLESTAFGEPELAGTGRDALDGPYPRARRSSGGLVSNVDDLLRFGSWHLGQPGAALMRAPRGKPVAGVYGLGLFGERVGGVEVWGHGGSYGGFQSSLLLVPDRGAVFAGLTNGSLGAKALDDLEAEFLEHVVGGRRRDPVPVELPAALLDSFVGSYANSDERLEVRAAPGGLVLSSEDVEYAARPIGQHTFEVTEGDATGERFDFPAAGFGRFGGRLAGRLA